MTREPAGVPGAAVSGARRALTARSTFRIASEAARLMWEGDARGPGRPLGRDARGRQPGQTRNPKGGRPYKRAYGEPDERAQSNFTDPESGIMKTSNEGFQQCYNAQAAVDAEHQLVVATDVTGNASDQGGLPVMLDQVEERFDTQPETVLADSGFCNERDLTELETRDVDGYVATGREDKQVADRDLEEASGDGSHGEEAVDAGGPGDACGAEVVVGGAVRLDQARAGLPVLQPAWAGEGAGRVGLGVPGGERQAPARADGGVTGTDLAPH